MDLRLYFQKLRLAEEKLLEAFPVMVSLDTDDGGRAGVTAEVSLKAAAKLLVDGRARAATPEEAEEFRQSRREAIAAEERRQEMGRLNVVVVSESDVRAGKANAKVSR